MGLPPNMIRQFFPDGKLSAEVTLTPQGTPTTPSLYQNPDGTLRSQLGMEKVDNFLEIKWQVKEQPIPNTIQDFVTGGDPSLQAIGATAFFQMPTQQTRTYDQKHVCGQRQGINGFSRDELILAGPTQWQQIRNRLLGFPTQFPGQVPF